MTRIDPSAPAVVFSALDDRVSHGVVGIVRTLGRLGVAVVVVRPDDHAPVTRSRYTTRAFPLPADAVDRVRIDVLERVAREIGGRPVLIPTDDAGALLVDAHAVALRDLYRLPERSVAMTSALANKIAMRDLCLRHGVDTPEIDVLRDLADLESFVERSRFPVVVKVAEAATIRRGIDVSVAIVRTPRELAETLAARPFGAPSLLVQEYIPGGPDTVWMFNGYFDGSSRCLFGATARKMRQYRPYTGITTLGECRPNQAVEATTLRLMAALGYRGVLDIGYRYDRRDGRYKLLDANPRVGATFRLFTGIGGTDVVRALYADLTGQRVEPDPVRPGRRWMLETHDPVSSLTYVRDGVLGVSDWLRSLRGVDEFALFAPDDAAPFVAAVGRILQPKVSPSVLRAGRVRRRAAAEEARARIDRFDEEADRWDAIYERTDPFAAIHQERLHRAVEAVRRWHPGARRVLDLGAGAGAMSATMSADGLDVVALDPSPAMLTRAAARFAPSPNRPSIVRGDGYALPFADQVFDVVVALGVVPWLDRPERMLDEARRVLRRDGLLIASADNKLRLVFLLDPWRNPYLSGIRRAVKSVLRSGRVDPSDRTASPHTLRQFSVLLRNEGFTLVGAETFGFGPVTFARRRLLPDPVDLYLGRRLQRLADRDIALLRALGSQHLAAVRRDDAEPRAGDRVGRGDDRAA